MTAVALLRILTHLKKTTIKNTMRQGKDAFAISLLYWLHKNALS